MKGKESIPPQARQSLCILMNLKCLTVRKMIGMDCSNLKMSTL